MTPSFHSFRARVRPWRLGLMFILCGLYAAELRGEDARLPAEPLRTAGDRPFDVRHIRLDLKVDLPARTVRGEATLSLRSLRALRSIRLDAVEFAIHRVSFSYGAGPGHPARFAHDGNHLVVDLEQQVPAGTEMNLVVNYTVRDPRAGLHFFGPTRTDPTVPLTVWSQGEAITNRYWFPCLDQPNQRQSTELVVTTAADYEVLSNGKLVERVPHPAEKTVTWHWKQEQPHPSYLVTLVVGKFAVVRETWEGVPVLFYVPPGRAEDAARTFGRTHAMLDFFSRRFGVRYPWEKYAQVTVEQFTHGGMENTSATTLTDRALHDARAFLDSDADGLIAHELAHQWLGDMVTCRDWAHIWLNEGFASYAEALWEEQRRGPDDYARLMSVKGRAARAGDKDRPIVDRRYPNPRSMFDARAYPKGAFVLHMLRQRLGDDAFFQGLRRHAEVNRFRSVETADFRRALEEVSGRDLELFFYDWTERPGHPALDINTEYDAETHRLRLHVKQTQAGEAFRFPLKVHVALPSVAKPLVLEEEIRDNEHRITLPVPGRPLRVEIDPAEAVLADVNETKGRDLWSAQLAEGSTFAARARAADHFAKSKAPADREILAKALAGEKYWGVQVEIAGALAASGGDVCRAALVAGLKEANPKVRRACAEALGHFVHDEAAAHALADLLAKSDASYFVGAAALSSYARLNCKDTANVLLPWLAKSSHDEVLRTAVLRGLGQAGDRSALDTLVAWTQAGRPRQCRVAALEALGTLGQRADLGEAQTRKVVEIVTGYLESEGPVLRRASALALRELGRAAVPALPVLEALARHDANDRVVEAAKQAVERVLQKVPPQAEVARLRQELEQLRRAQDTLRQRVDGIYKAP